MTKKPAKNAKTPAAAKTKAKAQPKTATAKKQTDDTELSDEALDKVSGGRGSFEQALNRATRSPLA